MLFNVILIASLFSDIVFSQPHVLISSIIFSQYMENNAVAPLYQKGEEKKSGLNATEPAVIKKLQDGQFYGHTGKCSFNIRLEDR